MCQRDLKVIAAIFQLPRNLGCATGVWPSWDDDVPIGWAVLWHGNLSVFSYVGVVETDDDDMPTSHVGVPDLVDHPGFGSSQPSPHFIDSCAYSVFELVHVTLAQVQYGLQVFRSDFIRHR